MRGPRPVGETELQQVIEKRTGQRPQRGGEVGANTGVHQRRHDRPMQDRRQATGEYESSRLTGFDQLSQTHFRGVRAKCAKRKA